MLAELKKLADEFSTQPLTRGREMRELLEYSPTDFCAAVVEVLGGEAPERVQRYLVALLWTSDLLIPCLSNPSTPMKKAEDIVALARRVDPQLPAKLVAFVLDRTRSEPAECLERILGLLRAMPDAVSFRPLLSPLLQHPDARVRSKVALLAGEGNRNVTWFARRMQQDDPRVRANAIESGAVAVTEDLRPVFKAGAMDSNNRVVGNALIALYRLGDAEAVAGLYDLAARPEPEFRATAVWAMGETGDTRFLPALTRILTNPNEAIKGAALKAIRKLRLQENAEAAPLDIRILGEPIPSESSLKVPFVVSLQGEHLARIAATNVRVRVNDQFVCRYTIAEQESRRRMCAAFLLPRMADQNRERVASYRQALEQCFELRGAGDGWTFADYSAAPSPSTVTRPDTLFGVRMDSTRANTLQSVSNVEEIRKALNARDPAKGRDLTAAFQDLCQDHRKSRGSAQLFLVDPQTISPIDPVQLSRVAKEAHVIVHGLCSSPDPGVREICRATGGFYAVSQDIQETLSAFYQGISHRYIAHLTLDGRLRSLQVAVRTPECYGASPIISSAEDF